jgi:hypothetical protein
MSSRWSSKPVKLPSQQELNSLFNYDPETGILTRRWSGRPVIGGNKRGHVVVGVGRKFYLAHRIIWKIMTGDDPENFIDHIDCNGKNNRWINLREASHAENLRNRGAPKNNTSGIKGVSFCKATGLWRAGISAEDGHVINLGRFKDIKQASEARRIASEKMHGQFARLA